VTAGGALAYGLLGWPTPSPTLPSAVPAPVEGSTTVVAGGTSAEGPSTSPAAGSLDARPQGAPQASGSQGAPVSPVSRRWSGPSPCVAAYFPADTFKLAAPKLEFVCTERDVRRGATALRIALVRARRIPGASTAMRELDELGWYQLAFFAIVRATCCAAPSRLATHAGIHACPLDERLEELGRAAQRADETRMKAALDGFVDATSCLARQGAASAFGQMRPPSLGAAALLQEMIKRQVAASAAAR
jgi:hypothetical protein